MLFFKTHKNIILLWLVCTLLPVLTGCKEQRYAGDQQNKFNSTEKAFSDSSVVQTSPELNFTINDGKHLNLFFRQESIAAHTVLTSGESPRLVVAFPAGNSGVSLWFEPNKEQVNWQVHKKTKAVKQTDGNNNTLYGVQMELTSGAKELTVKQAILGNVRVIRDYLHTNSVPENINNQLVLEDDTIVWQRSRLDGQSAYQLTLQVLNGEVMRDVQQKIHIRAAADKPLRLMMTALTGDKPLTPIKLDELLIANAIDPQNTTQKILAFLSYREKLLAGSWRFATYFGRDTLMSLRLLMPVLTPLMIESSLGSVIERINNKGEVAHEEDLAEFALLQHLSGSGDLSIAPIYDYKMVDDDYMLAPILAHYLLDKSLSNADALAFLQTKTADGMRFGDKLITNFNHILNTTKAYSEAPSIDHLIHLKRGHNVGQWRDSDEGLGFGRIPYDVNVVWIPSALDAVAKLYESGLLTEFSAEQPLLRARVQERIWTKHASKHFTVTLALDEAQQSINHYAQALGIESSTLIPDENNKVSFSAIALNEQGKKIPVLHSDLGFTLLFTKPSPQRLENIVRRILQPFPAGLISPVGLMVANPAFAEPELQTSFTDHHYHGTVIWSWQQAVFAAGLAQQLSRTDIPESSKVVLQRGLADLWQVITASAKRRDAELWSWAYQSGEYVAQPFGQRSGDKTESNAAQLWSTVYLGIKPPLH